MTHCVAVTREGPLTHIRLEREGKLNAFDSALVEQLDDAVTEAANNESRAAAVVEHAAYWGNGWYILPNPMHGAWTSTH